MGRYTGVGMPKPKKKKVEKPQSTADSSRDDPPAPASPPRGPAPSKPPPSPPSPAKQRVQAMEIPVTENWKGFCLVEKKLKAAEKQFKLEMRIIEAKERSLKQRRPTKSAMAMSGSSFFCALTGSGMCCSGACCPVRLCWVCVTASLTCKRLKSSA